MNESSVTTSEPNVQPPKMVQPAQIKQLSLRARVVSWFYGFALPLICFVVAAATDGLLIDQPWQSGEAKMYAAMLLRPSAWLPFIPWLLPSLCAFAWWTYQPLVAAEKLWVRCGLYSGVILSIQFWIVILFSHGPASLIATLFVLPSIFAFSLIVSSVAAHYKRFQIWHLLVLTTMVAVLIAAIGALTSNDDDTLFAAPFFVLAAAPTLNMLAYMRAALVVSQIDRSQGHQSRRLWPLLIAWTIGWLISWRFAVQAMLKEYSNLPVNNPNCYFANAAAHAHVRLGGTRLRAKRRPSRGAQPQAAPRTAYYPVTLTMKRLKFLELAVQAAAPGLHGVIRQHYDRWGKPAARYCEQYGWFADLTCLALKPIEALAELVRCAAGVTKAQIEVIYARNPGRSEG